MTSLPESLRPLFWGYGFDDLDAAADADSVLARILERGRMADVRWTMDHYGLERIHRFFREVGHPELSERTLGFWRCVLRAEDETWQSPPAWRKSSSAPWID